MQSHPRLVESVGYWIVVILIALGGILVLLAASSVRTDEADQVPPIITARSQKPSAPQPRLPSEVAPLIPLVLFIPRSWTQHWRFEIMPEFKGTSTSLTMVEGSMIAELAASIESNTNDLGDSVVTILSVADDYLAGHPLDFVLDQLDRLLERLSDLPAMAVVGSIPDVVPALDDYMTGVSISSLSTTIAVWNQAIADLAGSYSAEYVDLSTVPVEFVSTDSGDANQMASVCPDLSELMVALAPAICRAAERVRSFRAIS